MVNTLFKKYQGTVDYEGENYCGLTFDWNYEKEYVDLSMPHYVQNVLKRLVHVKKVYPQYSPHIAPPSFS